MTPFRAPGLDGTNPLGFFAALGLLSVLSVSNVRRAAPRVAWVIDGHWQPVFDADCVLDDAVNAVMADKAAWAFDPALALAYDASGALVDPWASPGSTRDLKPPPRTMRAFLEQTVERATYGEAMTIGWRRRTLQVAAAYGSDVIQDNNGNTKPTAFHFTAGQQRFLDAIARLQEALSEDQVREALIGPWSGTSSLPSMSWDSTMSRSYALRAGDPSKEKRGSNPGADWLAFVGLSFTRVAPNGGRLLTTGVRGNWKDSSFAWPLWTVPVPAALVPALLGLADLRNMAPAERQARGVGSVMCCGITRSDQGGYGGFSPSAVV